MMLVWFIIVVAVGFAGVCLLLAKIHDDLMRLLSQEDAEVN